MSNAASQETGGPTDLDNAHVFGRLVLMTVTIASVAFFGYRVAVLVAAGLSRDTNSAIADLVISALAAIVGVGYFAWAAISNRSIIMFCFGLSESCLVAGAALPIFRAAKDASPFLAVAIALVVLVAWAYTWKEFRTIHTRVHSWTGLS